MKEMRARDKPLAPRVDFTVQGGPYFGIVAGAQKTWPQDSAKKNCFHCRLVL